MSLDDLRQQIDSIDKDLVELINKRAKVVVEVGKYKSKTSTPIYAPDREKMVFKRIHGANNGPLPDKTLTAVWRELMSGSFFLERPLRIAFLGPNGSFTHAASMRKFGQSVEYEAVTDIRSVFSEVAKGHSDLGVVPVENSTGGGVIETLDAFIDYDVKICAELYMQIHQNLLANCAIEDIEVIYSKPEVFAQCRNWLAATFKETKTVAVASTSKAAQLAANEPKAAAIGSVAAGELYDLRVICENIEDITNNVTRFLILSNEDTKPTGDDKTVIFFTIADKVGALVDVLQVFRKYGLNMTNIGSRPSKKRNWEYYFFVDMVGHRKSEEMKKAIEEIKEHCLQVTVLGSFPSNMTLV